MKAFGSIALLAGLLIQLGSATNYDSIPRQFARAMVEDSLQIESYASALSAAADEKKATRHSEAAKLIMATYLMTAIKDVRNAIIEPRVQNTKNQRQDVYVKNVLRAHSKADSAVAMRIKNLIGLSAELPVVVEKVNALTELMEHRLKSLAAYLESVEDHYNY